MVSMSSESVDVPINNGETTRRKVHTTSPPNDSTAESSPALLKNNKVTLRKQTQDIAARAAQRRANLHHKELMEDMGKKFSLKKFIEKKIFFLIGSVFSSEPVVSKENTASAFGLEITGVKPKKTVTINDPQVVCNIKFLIDCLSFDFIVSLEIKEMIYVVQILIHLNLYNIKQQQMVKYFLLFYLKF